MSWPGHFGRGVFFMSEDEKLARSLVEKAEHDLHLVKMGLEHGAFLDVICFHLQQAAEKLIKALLAARHIDYPHTHDLEQFIELATPPFPEIAKFREAFSGFGGYAVAMRYDTAYYPDRDEVLAAWKVLNEFRAFIHARLPPEVRP